MVWSWTQTDAGNPMQPLTNPGSSFTFATPGTFQITAAITYKAVPRPGGGVTPPPPYTASRPVVIQTPALTRIVPSVPSAPYAANPPATATATGPNQMGGSSGQWVYFVLQSNGKTIGPFNALGAQEQISNYFLLGVDQKTVPTWRPNNPAAVDPRDQGTDSSFTFGEMADGSNDFAIFDFKTTYYGDASYQGAVSQYDQEIRVTWTDLSGASRQSPTISKIRLYFNGIGDGTWNDRYIPL